MRDDREWLQDILEAIERIEKFPSDKLEAAKRIFRSADDPVTILGVLEG